MIDNRYAAGFFDGEGCVHIARNLRVLIGGCFRPGLLEQFAERWGGKIAKQRDPRPRARQGIRWEITGPRAATFLRDVLPFLYEKEAQAVVALRYHDLKVKFGVRGGKGYTVEQKAAFIPLEMEVKELKHVQWYL